MGEESMKKYDLLILEIVVRNFFIFCLWYRKILLFYILFFY
jgi:hypothetical protein